MKYKKVILEALAFAASALFFWLILRAFGFHALWEILRKAGWGTVAVSFFYPVMSLWDVGAWRILFFREHSHKIRFFDLFWIRLAGEALNNITPFLDIGGEPLKAHLLARRFHLPLGIAATSTMVAKTSTFMSQALFMLVGSLLSFFILPLSMKYRFELGTLLLVICGIFSAFLILQQKGVFHKLNPEIRHFYRQEAAQFQKAVCLNFMGWIFGGLETYFICHLAGVPVSLFEAVILESLLQLIRTGSFFVPMNLGIQEGGMAYFVSLWGFNPIAGVGISLLKRFRQILWMGIGFSAWGVFKFSKN